MGLNLNEVDSFSLPYSPNSGVKSNHSPSTNRPKIFAAMDGVDHLSPEKAYPSPPPEHVLASHPIHSQLPRLYQQAYPQHDQGFTSTGESK